MEGGRSAWEPSICGAMVHQIWWRGKGACFAAATKCSTEWIQTSFLSHLDTWYPVPVLALVPGSLSFLFIRLWRSHEEFPAQVAPLMLLIVLGWQRSHCSGSNSLLLGQSQELATASRSTLARVAFTLAPYACHSTHAQVSGPEFFIKGMRNDNRANKHTQKYLGRLTQARF